MQALSGGQGGQRMFTCHRQHWTSLSHPKGLIQTSQQQVETAQQHFHNHTTQQVGNHPHTHTTVGQQHAEKYLRRRTDAATEQTKQSNITNHRQLVDRHASVSTTTHWTRHKLHNQSQMLPYQRMTAMEMHGLLN